MELFITTEAQGDINAALSVFLREVTEKLSFVTNKQTNLREVNNYGTEFQEIAIIPSCVDDEFWDALGWKERKQIWRKKGEADIRLRMDHERFKHATPKIQRLLFIQIIIESIQVVISRSKGDFTGEKLIEDILCALDVSKDELDQL